MHPLLSHGCLFWLAATAGSGLGLRARQLPCRDRHGWQASPTPMASLTWLSLTVRGHCLDWNGQQQYLGAVNLDFNGYR